MPDAGRKGRHAAIIRELDIPAPFNLEEFTARLERQRNRPIRLCPFRSGPGVPCGVWIAIADADYVYYEQDTTRFHVNLIVLHEIAHMVLGHQGLPAWQNLARQIAPDVHPGLVRLLLSRSAYASPEEREAETLASRILERATSWPGAEGRFGVPAGYAPEPRRDDCGPADLTTGCGRSGSGG
jgi:hypothetical protein